MTVTGRHPHWAANGVAKRRFITKNHAKLVARRTQAMGGPRMMAYACHLCGGYHVGHPGEA